MLLLDWVLHLPATARHAHTTLGSRLRSPSPGHHAHAQWAGPRLVVRPEASRPSRAGTGGHRHLGLFTSRHQYLDVATTAWGVVVTAGPPSRLGTAPDVLNGISLNGPTLPLAR